MLTSDIRYDRPQLESQLSSLLMAVRVAEPSDDVEKLTNFVEGRFDCGAFYWSEITDRLQMLLQLRRAMAQAVCNRTQLGVKRGLSPEDLCHDVCYVFESAD